MKIAHSTRVANEVARAFWGLRDSYTRNPDLVFRNSATHYQTEIAAYCPDTETLTIRPYYSLCTFRRINAILEMAGLPTISVRDRPQSFSVNVKPPKGYGK